MNSSRLTDLCDISKYTRGGSFFLIEEGYIFITKGRRSKVSGESKRREGEREEKEEGETRLGINDSVAEFRDAEILRI